MIMTDWISPVIAALALLASVVVVLISRQQLKDAKRTARRSESHQPAELPI
jgi:hypothetical protein